MANGILAQAILSQRAPDIVGQFEAGRQAATQQQAVEQQQLAQQQLGALLGQQLPQQFQALAQSDPSLALQAAQATGAPIGGRARQAELARSLQIINQVGSVDQNAAFNLAQREVDLLRSQGVDTSNLQAEIEQGRQNPEAFFKGVGARVQAFQQAGILARPEVAKQKNFAPVTLVNPKTKEKILASPTIGPDGQPMLSEFDIPEGFEVSKETGEEKRRADVLASAEKKRKQEAAKGIEVRRSGIIERGTDAARSIPTLTRTLDILDTVSTGGIAEASLKAKQFFGVESADEAELANLLGVNVLQQLKPTFGAQFTENEGKRLERILQSFGKSREGNVRLVKQAINIAKQAAKRGLKAAEGIDDSVTIDEIQSNLDFKVQGEEQTTQTPAGTQTVGRFQVRVK